MTREGRTPRRSGVTWPPPVQPTPELVASAVERFYALMLGDPLLRPWFVGIDIVALRSHVTEFLLIALGSGRHQTSRPQAMRDRLESAHRGLGIDDEAFDRSVTHLATALRHIGMTGCQLDEAVAVVAALRPHVVDPVR